MSCVGRGADECGHQFPQAGQPRFKTFPACSALNANSARDAPRQFLKLMFASSLWLPDEAKIETEQEEDEMDDGAATAQGLIGPLGRPL
jgi:hypothetical protein